MLRELFEQKVVFPGHYIALSSVVSLPGSDCVVEVLFLGMDLSHAEDGIFPLIGREVTACGGIDDPCASVQRTTLNDSLRLRLRRRSGSEPPRRVAKRRGHGLIPAEPLQS